MKNTRRTIPGINDVFTLDPEFAKRFSSKSLLQPHQVTLQSNRKALFRCSKGHEWLARVSTVYNGGGCVYCHNLKVLTGFNDLESQYPQVSKLYSSKNSLLPSEILAGGSKKYLWNCSVCKGQWINSVRNQINTNGCVYCNGYRLLTGFNDFQTLYPEEALLWSEKNKLKPYEVFPHTNKQYYWACQKHGNWLAPVNRIVSGSVCKKCALNSFRSNGEKELFTFVSKFTTTIPTERKLLKNYELDIYCPELNLAIEYNGDYWHSDKVLKKSKKITSKQYHQNKRNACKKKNIRLLYIWESDWRNKNDEIKCALKTVIMNPKSDIPPILNILSKG